MSSECSGPSLTEPPQPEPEAKVESHQLGNGEIACQVCSSSCQPAIVPLASEIPSLPSEPAQETQIEVQQPDAEDSVPPAGESLGIGEDPEPLPEQDQYGVAETIPEHDRESLVHPGEGRVPPSSGDSDVVSGADGPDPGILVQDNIISGDPSRVRIGEGNQASGRVKGRVTGNLIL